MLVMTMIMVMTVIMVTIEHIALLCFSILWMLIIQLDTSDDGGDNDDEDDDDNNDDGVNGDDE